MKKHELLKSGDSILRVLDVQEARVLVLDCVRRIMPYWTDNASLEAYKPCSDDVLEPLDDRIYWTQSRGKPCMSVIP